MSSKYVKGKKITSFDRLIELVNQNKSVYWGNQVRNASWVQNQMLRTLTIHFDFYETEEIVCKTITKGLFPTNDPNDKYVNCLIIKPIKDAVGIKFYELPNLRKVIISNGNSKKPINIDLIISVVKQCKNANIDIEFAKSVSRLLNEDDIQKIWFRG